MHYILTKHRKRVAVVGSGISGSSCARILSDNNIEVDIYEKNSFTGGLVHCSYEEDDILFHRIGGHVFNSKMESILDWFWKQFNKDEEFIQTIRNASILIGDKFIGYPIENNIYQLDEGLCKNIINDFMNISRSQGGASINTSDSTFRNFLLTNFGQTLCQLYFFPYNEKIWNNKLEFPISWLDGKLPMPRINDILLSLIKRKSESEMVHSTFYYPRSGGSQFIINKLLNGINVLKAEVTHIIKDENKLFINGNLYDSLIYTGDVRKIFDITCRMKDINFNNDLKSSILNLSTNQSSTVLCECDKNPYSWIYIPSGNVSCHRIIMTGNFSTINNGKNIEVSRTTCTVEFSKSVGREKMIRDINSLPYNMRPIAFNDPKDSYVIQEKSTRVSITKIKEILEQNNIFLCGRFAEWEYCNMDVAISSAMDVCSKIILV